MQRLYSFGRIVEEDGVMTTEGVGVLVADVGLDAADGQAARGGVGLFRLLPPLPHPAGSRCEAQWALPPRPLVLALRLHNALRDNVVLFREAYSA